PFSFLVSPIPFTVPSCLSLSLLFLFLCRQTKCSKDLEEHKKKKKKKKRDGEHREKNSQEVDGSDRREKEKGDRIMTGRQEKRRRRKWKERD
ncbi:hypothetical protein, partial [Aeromonas salmonicida]|uniref:hypothetical protein n=1 Tax=Aeromonas salmonicida TaxID=645 RepID=UPI003D31F151